MPLPSKDELKKIYESKKYFKALSLPQRNPLLQWVSTRRIYKTPAEWVKERFQPSTILDVGCGNGEFLDELSGEGYDVYGTDISKIAAQRTSEKIGKDKVVSGDFLRYNSKSRFKIISFWHLLEHIENPDDYLKKSGSLLMPGGFLLGEMPNLESPLLNIFGPSYAWIIIPEHLIYFSRKSLKILLRRVGFTSIEIYSPPRGLLNFSFSLEKSLQKTKLSAFLRKPIFILSIPFSIVLGYLFSLAARGEVLRFMARK